MKSRLYTCLLKSIYVLSNLIEKGSKLVVDKANTINQITKFTVVPLQLKSTLKVVSLPQTNKFLDPQFIVPISLLVFDESHENVPLSFLICFLCFDYSK